MAHRKSQRHEKQQKQQHPKNPPNHSLGGYTKLGELLCLSRMPGCFASIHLPIVPCHDFSAAYAKRPNKLEGMQAARTYPPHTYKPPK